MRRAPLLLLALLGCTRAPPEPCRYSLSAAVLSITPNLDDDDHDGRRDGLGDTIAPEDNDLETLRLESSCPEVDLTFSVHLEPAEAGMRSGFDRRGSAGRRAGQGRDRDAAEDSLVP
jgi:hypothetical protein